MQAYNIITSSNPASLSPNTNSYNPINNNVGPTAASALLFNSPASINTPNDINNIPTSKRGGMYDGTQNQNTVTSYSVSPYSNVANFRQQQQLQRNLFISKQQKAAAAAHNQPHNFLRHQNNTSHKRILYHNANYGFFRPLPSPPIPRPSSPNKNTMASCNVANSSDNGVGHQRQFSYLSQILRNNARNYLDPEKVNKFYLQHLITTKIIGFTHIENNQSGISNYQYHLLEWGTDCIRRYSDRMQRKFSNGS